jgi:NAD(P)-dependent dehydrogenase (short-subunit alcohol dehydrogenase family)
MASRPTPSCPGSSSPRPEPPRAQSNPLYERFKNRTVFKRFGEPGDIAASIGFLCTEEAGYITGSTLEVAGGIPLFTA